MTERFELARERIKECQEERFPIEAYDAYFKEVSGFLLELCRQYSLIADGQWEIAKDLSLEELQALNDALYYDAMPAQYETSFLNPAYAVKELEGFVCNSQLADTKPECSNRDSK